MLHLLNVVGQLAEQKRVDSMHLTYHSPYNVTCNGECHVRQTVVNGAGRVGSLFGGIAGYLMAWVTSRTVILQK